MAIPCWKHVCVFVWNHSFESTSHAWCIIMLAGVLYEILSMCKWTCIQSAQSCLKTKATARPARVYARRPRGSRVDRPQERGNHVTRCNTVGLHKIIQKQHVDVKDQSAQRPMQTAWYIYKRSSYNGGWYSQNRRATPRFVAIKCVFILLQDSFPAWPRVIDATFR